jgi:hypothetical protein
MGNPHIYWNPYRLDLRTPNAPGAGTWQQLDSYAGFLRSLNLPDPTKATARRVAAEHVRDEAQRLGAGVAVEHDNSITTRLADGSMTAKDAAKMLAKQPDAKEAEATATKMRLGLEEQCRELLRLAVLAIHEYGAGWLDVLRPIAAEALKTRDQERWNRVHELAAWLRDPTWAGVCGLSAAMASNTQDCEPVLYAVADPRALFLWRVEHADPRDQVPGSVTVLPDGSGHIVPIVLAPHAATPTVDDFAENAAPWKPGLYSAEQVIENMHRGLTAQDAEVDALMRPVLVT